MINVDTGNGVPIALKLAIKDFCIHMGYSSSSCENCPLGYSYRNEKDAPRYLCVLATRAAIANEVNDDIKEALRQMNWRIV